MPKPKEGQTKDEYISYCISYIKKNEPEKAKKGDAYLYKHCEGLWKKYKEKNNDNLKAMVNKLDSMGYKPFAFTSSDMGIMRMDEGTIEMSELRKETKYDDENTKENPREYDVVDAVIAVGDKFYGDVYVPSSVLRASANKWNGTYHDLSHLATAFPAGLGAVENMEYIVGYNSDAYFDESVNGVRAKFHISHDAPKYKVWKNFYDVTRDAKNIPNVSIFGFTKFKAVKKDSLPAGTKFPASTKDNDYVIVMADLIPFAVTTCLRGKCNDSEGCGISTGYKDDGTRTSCDSGYCQVKVDDEKEKNVKDNKEVKNIKKEMSKERQERLKYLRI